MLPTRPYNDLIGSARELDDADIIKQRIVCPMIISVLLKEARGEDGGGWAHHPGVELWRGYLGCLMLWHDILQDEWYERGHLQLMLGFTTLGARFGLHSDEEHRETSGDTSTDEWGVPPWL